MSMNHETHRYTTDIKGYQDAVWDYLLEHSEITESGKIFVKFHTDGRKNFENRVLSRWKYNYHREDVRAKALKLQETKLQHLKNQKEKKEKYKAEKKARIEKLKKKKGVLHNIINLIKKPNA